MDISGRRKVLRKVYVMVGESQVKLCRFSANELPKAFLYHRAASCLNVELEVSSMRLLSRAVRLTQLIQSYNVHR